MSWRVKPRSAALCLLAQLVAPASLAGQLAPPSTGGVAALDQLLQRLAEPRRVLMIGAHPDDEDTSLLALLALGYGADVAYLSVSRGEGGQNLIGPELGVGLGLLRSRELLAARERDGARQFFARGFDFGYSRSLDEASRHWPPDSILKDVVRVVRRFRPHVIVSIFSGTPRDGHGQHQAAGVAAFQAFDAAGDPHRFPELGTEERLEPWTPLKLYRSARFDRASATLTLATGGLDPRLGRTYHQVAMASRSQHRSQDMGQLQAIGPRWTRLQFVRGRAGGGEDAALFAGIPRDDSELTRFAREMRDELAAGDLASAAPALADRLRTARDRSVDGRSVGLLERAVAVAAGLMFDAVASDGEVIPGQPVDVTLSVYNGGPFEVALDSVAAIGPAGWQVGWEQGGSVTVPPGSLVTRAGVVTVPEGAPTTQPYFLARSLVGSLYDWSEAPAEVRGLPFQPPVLRARTVVSLLGVVISMDREVSFRYNTQGFGEVRREVRVVPRIDVKMESDDIIWPVGEGASRRVNVRLTHNGMEQYEGEVRLVADGWPDPAPQQFAFVRSGETKVFTFVLQRPPGIREASLVVRAVAAGDDGREFTAGVALVDYPHIRATPWVRPAASPVRVAPIALPAISRLGYVRGAADRVPEALAQIGLPVELLDPAQLAESDLGRYDVIVVGSRAYESDSALMRNNDRLLEYTRSGGLVVVQYQQYAYVRGGYAPYPLTIARPHDRVTDEAAPVRLLDPDHPVFRAPNRIRPEDWEGWPQERGLYFARSWDAAYRPLLEMSDPGEAPLRGGLLVARYGAGTYVYTGLSFFRALPAGNIGALRLFLNLLDLKPEYVP